MRMFHEQEFYYTLEPPALGSNPVDRFLFDTRQGFCEHYASAFAVLMRAAGIPSREQSIRPCSPARILATADPRQGIRDAAM